jgi:hypothetical protein
MIRTTYLEARLLLVKTMETLQKLYRVQAYSTLPLAPVVRDVNVWPGGAGGAGLDGVPGSSALLSCEDDMTSGAISSTSEYLSSLGMLVLLPPAQRLDEEVAMSLLSSIDEDMCVCVCGCLCGCLFVGVSKSECFYLTLFQKTLLESNSMIKQQPRLKSECLYKSAVYSIGR